MRMVDITALGELLIDFTEYGSSASGMRLFEQNPGGAVANVVCAAARLGVSTAFIGKIGGDIHGEFLVSVLRREGVDTRNLIISPGHNTTVAFVALGKKGEREFSFYRKNAADVSLETGELNRELIRNSKILHIGTVSITDDPARSATLAAVAEARRASAIISCDINFRPSLWSSRKDMLYWAKYMLPMVDMLKVSEEEGALLTGEDDPQEMSHMLMRDYSIPCIAVTCGERGAFIRCRKGTVRVPAVPAKVVDTTGAGDAFWAAFLYSFIKSGIEHTDISSEQAEDFGRFATAAASICVESTGAIPSMPGLDSVLKRVKT
jgi:fructokinase